MIQDKSKELYERALLTVPGGLNANGRFRSPHPLYMRHAEGAYVIDIDGNRYIDLLMGNGSILLGHNNPEFNRKVTNMKGRSDLLTGFDTLLSVETAEKFCNTTKNEKVRFVNTGTEAIMHCIRISRAYTGREKIAVMEGAYNGWCDQVFVNSFAPLNAIGHAERPESVPGTGGLSSKIVEDTLVLPFNNIVSTEKLIHEHKNELAAIILEVVMIDVGYIEANREYLQFLRSICDECGIILIFDELLTGFRLSLGGAKEYYGVNCDMAIYGKAMANGYIIAAVAGKSHILDVSAPGGLTTFNGTFNGHQLSLCAASAMLDMLEDGRITREITTNAEYLRDTFAILTKDIGINARLVGYGGHFQVYFVEKQPHDYRSAAISNKAQYRAYVDALEKNGVLCSQNPLSHHALSLAHDRTVINEILVAMEKSLLMAKKEV